MNYPYGRLLLALLAFTLIGGKCEKQKEAELRMAFINLTSAYSMEHRVSIPVAKLARWMSLTQEITTGLEIVRDHKITSKERKEIYERLDSGPNRNGFEIVGLELENHRVDIAIEKIGFEGMQLGTEFYAGVVQEILDGNVLAGLVGKSRKVDDWQERPGWSVNVFEPTLAFGDSAGGRIFADVRVSARFKIKRNSREAGTELTPVYLPLHARATVIIKQASIPVDVFYDEEESGVVINPPYRSKDFSIGKCTVRIEQVEFVKLPMFLRQLTETLIERAFSDQLSAEIQKAIPYYYFKSSDEHIQGEVHRLLFLLGLDAAGSRRN